MPKTEKVKVEVTCTVPSGTSKTKVAKTINSLLKSGSGENIDGWKIGSAKPVEEAQLAGAAAPSSGEGS